MSLPEKKLPVPSASLDISVQYKGVLLNNTTVELFVANSSMDTGSIPLGDNGRATIVVNQTPAEVNLRLRRTPKPPQDDTSKYPVLGGDFAFGPIAGSARVMIIVADPT